MPPTQPGALVVTLATLAVSHHSALPARAHDPLSVNEAPSDHSASPWSMRGGDGDEIISMDDADVGDARTSSATKTVGSVSPGEPRAPKRRAERVKHTSPFESESETTSVDDDDAERATKVMRTHHRVVSSGGGDDDSSFDLAFATPVDGDDFEIDPVDAFDPEARSSNEDAEPKMGQRESGSDAMDLEEYAGLARARRIKLEHFELVLRDTETMTDMLQRAVLKVKNGELKKPTVKGDISRELGFEFSSSLAEKRRQQMMASSAEAFVSHFGKSTKTSETAVDGGQAAFKDGDDFEIDQVEVFDPELNDSGAAKIGTKESRDADADANDDTKDEFFEDASWAEDDYRTSLVATKDVTAENDLDQVLTTPGAPSEKIDDETMRALLKHVEANKTELSDAVIRDDGELDEDAFIQELVREGAIVAPEDEPEKAKKTIGGLYLDGEFDKKQLKRIIGEEDSRTQDERVNSFPKLASEDVEDNTRDEIPEAFVEQDVDAMEDAFDNLKETLDSRFESADAPKEAPGPEAEAAEAPEEAPGPEEAEDDAAEAPAPAADDAAEAPGPSTE